MEYVAHKAVWFPDRLRLAGRTLRPPTLGQIRLLEAINSPLRFGGRVETLDVALALYVLSTPWRRARRALLRMPVLAWTLSWWKYLPGLRKPSTASTLSAWIARSMWTPEQYEADADRRASTYDPATGWSVRMALRASRLPLSRICHKSPGSWDCIWDVPVCAIMAYIVADEETHNVEFQTRAETEAVNNQKKEPHP
jgi:hypothetical protein